MVDIATFLDIGTRSLLAARTALNVTANNIANANTPEYSRQEVILESAPPVATSEGMLPGGVLVREVRRHFDALLTAQVIDFQSRNSRDSVLADVLSEVEVLFQDSDAGGLGTDLSRFFAAVQDLSNHPQGSAERTVLQTAASRLADTFQSASKAVSAVRQGIDPEIKAMMNRLNGLVSQIGSLNLEIVKLSTNTTASDLRDRRDQAIRELAELVNIKTIAYDDGGVDVLLGAGRSLVDHIGTTVEFLTAGNPNNQGMVDVQLRVPGGAIQTVTAEITGGRLGGLLKARDTHLPAYLGQLDTLASTLVQQVNLIHTQGVGSQAAPALTSDYAVTDVNEELGTVDAGLPFSSLVQDGSFDIIVYDGSGAVSVQQTLTIDKDTGGTTLASLAAVLDAVSGVSASVDAATGKLTITADGSNRFAFRNDTSRVLTALGLNNLFKGSTADDIALGTEVAANATLIATGKVDASGVFSSGDNSNFLDLADLEHSRLLSSNSETFHEAYAALVGVVGNDVADASTGVQQSEILLARLEERRSAVSGVSVDEELSNLIRYQQTYSAAARLIAVAQGLTDTLLEFLQ
ncbi:MAG: flagellar hook-associated protein FlgK [Candidatus Tectomicrobia bacterium]|nr:flagellar hook-associated protein FlgK [Candidatus Tectomicrobia bacterium]